MTSGFFSSIERRMAQVWARRGLGRRFLAAGFFAIAFWQRASSLLLFSRPAF